MTKIEKTRMEKLVLRQKVLKAEIKAMNAQFDDLSETEKRKFDQYYGECIGIEKALGLLDIPFESVDD